MDQAEAGIALLCSRAAAADEEARHLRHHQAGGPRTPPSHHNPAALPMNAGSTEVSAAHTEAMAQSKEREIVLAHQQAEALRGMHGHLCGALEHLKGMLRDGRSLQRWEVQAEGARQRVAVGMQEVERLEVESEEAEGQADAAQELSSE